MEYEGIDKSEALSHYGMPRRSGRYPWGSGKTPQRSKDVYAVYRQLHGQGLKDKEIAAMWNISTTKLKAVKSIGSNQARMENVRRAEKLKEHGYSNSEIGRRMGINESSVRSLLDTAKKARMDRTQKSADTIQEFVDKHRYVDIGAGTEIALGISPDRMRTAVEMLKVKGYQQHNVLIDQLGTKHQTTIKCLVPPDVSKDELEAHKFDIKPVSDVVIDTDGVRLAKSEPITNIDKSRVAVRYAEDGGGDKDGVIELRRGCEDLNLGKASYAQVRIGIDGTHYAKGMAIYSDNLPDGVDILFNTSKPSSVPMFGPKNDTVFKPQKSDPENPFGASIKDQEKLTMVQTHYKDKDGNIKLSALNIVNEEGTWESWARSLSSQFLSKQSVPLARQQLEQRRAQRAQEFEEICALTNPTVKKVLLAKFAETCDHDAVDLKAAPLPHQAAKVILPITNIKETEVYAPGYANGTRVVLVRFPHQSVTEIPELVVNNKNAEGRSVVGNAIDAIGIHPNVAKRMSGADFDGDSVLIIPANNPDGKVKIHTEKQYDALKNFDPAVYTLPKTRKDEEIMTSKEKGKQMGIVSNLITDMTLQQAPEDHMVRAIKHAMVVIDAEKHEYDWKASERDNNIDELKRLYQKRAGEYDANGEQKYGGSGTIVSRAKSPIRIDEVKDTTTITARRWDEEKKRWIGNTDPETGEVYRDPTGSYYWKPKTSKRTGEVTFSKVTRQSEFKKMELVKDAFELTSGGSKETPGHPMEAVYANFANQMKAMGNAARKEYLATIEPPINKSAKELYAEERASLLRKVKEAEENSPKERQAQLLGNKMVQIQKEDNPDMDYEHIKKAKGQAIVKARKIVGAKKKEVEITDREWEAIQAGAIGSSTLKAVLNNANIDKVKQRAMPRSEGRQATPAMKSRIKALATNHTQAEIAETMNISASQVAQILKEM